MLSLFGATASFADDACLSGLTEEDLQGEYTIEIGPGTMTIVTGKGGERVHPAPLMTGTATIAVHDGVPVLYSDNIVEGGVLEIALGQIASDEKSISFLDDPALEDSWSDDMAAASGCESAITLPQLSGTGTLTGNGNAVPNSVQLLVYTQGVDGVSAMGLYDSVVVSEATGGTIVFHSKFQLSGT